MLGLPIFTLARYRGMGLSPGALRRAGVIASLGPSARDLGDVKLPPLNRDVDQGRIKNLDNFALASETIYKKTRTMDRDRSAVFLGGECSLIVGSLAGLCEVFEGRPGMLWMDSHGDFNTPESSPSGYIGGMCLAMAVGRGQKLGAGVEPHRPLIDEGAVVHLGSRALDPEEERALLSSGLGLIPMTEVRKQGVGSVADRASGRLSDRADWLVCHLDVDVVDPSLVPSVNYPAPGGLTVEEAVSVVQVLKRTGKLSVVDVTAYNPSFDPAGTCASSVVRLLRMIFG